MIIFISKIRFLECAMFDSNLPLKLLCQETSSQRNAQNKLSVDSTGSALSIADLYPGLF